MSEEPVNTVVDHAPSSAQPSELKMWLAVRTDIALPAGKLAVQAGHGFANCLLRAYRENPDLVTAYENDATPKIAVSVPNEPALMRISEEAAKAGIPFAFITDAGRTIFFEPTSTVCAFGPARRNDLPPYLRRLQLFPNFPPSEPADLARGVDVYSFEDGPSDLASEIAAEAMSNLTSLCQLHDDAADRFHGAIQAAAAMVLPRWGAIRALHSPVQPAPDMAAVEPVKRLFERCSVCSGSGLALNMEGEPDECRKCKGDTVVLTEPSEVDAPPVDLVAGDGFRQTLLVLIMKAKRDCWSSIQLRDVIFDIGWGAAQPHTADAPAPQVEPAQSLDDVRREARRQGMEEAAKIADFWNDGSVPDRIRAAAAVDPVRGEGGE